MQILFRSKLRTFISRIRGFSTRLGQKDKLLKQLKAKIEATGPISVADYMKEVLISPQVGYYMKKDVFGTSGDFITSPEISQIFGELIGVWFCNEWFKLGKPTPLQFVEFGPGRGTLADDVLRVFSKFMPANKVDLSVHLIEISPFMQDIQKKNLCIDCDDESTINSDIQLKEYRTKHGFPLKFYNHLEEVPEAFSLFLAHEFFDALPIHKFQKCDDGWKEILIDLKDDEFKYVLSRNPTPAAKFLIDSNEKRDHVEVCLQAGVLIEAICKRMKEDGGITLIVDYGHDGTKSDTFRGFRKHEVYDPLQDPGEADLTADVDFSYLKKCSNNKGYTVGPVSQAFFLKNMGINIRLEQLMANADSKTQELLKSGCDMLLDDMGQRFKFFAIYPTVLEQILQKFPPLGFN